MAKKTYIGINSAPREVKCICLGVEGAVKIIKKAFIGDKNNIPRLVFCAHEYGEPVYTWYGYTSCTASKTCVICEDVVSELTYDIKTEYNTDNENEYDYRAYFNSFEPAWHCNGWHSDHSHSYNKHYTDESGHYLQCDCGALEWLSDHEWHEGDWQEINGTNGHAHICSGCDLYKDFESHIPSADYYYDENDEANGHYLRCTKCWASIEGSGLPHEWDNGVCSVCGYSCPHTNIENGVCTKCGYVAVCSHSWSAETGKCIYCGEEHEHYFTGATWQVTDNGHYMCCQGCWYQKKECINPTYTDEITTEPTCNEPGVKTFTCDNCGEFSYTEEIPIVSTAHALGSWQEEGEYCGRRCGLCGELVVEEDHDWLDPVESDGGHIQNCDRGCGATMWSEHSYDELVESNNESHTLKCTCGATKQFEHSLSVIAKNSVGHTLGCTCGYLKSEDHDWEQDGAYMRCTVCKEVCQHPTDHISTAYEWVSDTIHEVTYTCGICKSSTTTYGSHTWEESSCKTATCTTPGISYQDCECGGQREVEIPADHKYIYTPNGSSHIVACSDCDYHDQEDHTPAAVSGNEHYTTCSKCGALYIVAEGHEEIYTELSDGSYKITCKSCDYEESGSVG